MTIEVLPVNKFKIGITKILNEIKKQDEVCIVTKNGYGVAVVLPIKRYNYLLSNLEDHLDEQDEILVHNVEKARREYRSGKFRYLEDIITSAKK